MTAADMEFQRLVDEFAECLAHRYGLPEDHVTDEVTDFCRALKACDRKTLRTVIIGGEVDVFVRLPDLSKTK